MKRICLSLFYGSLLLTLFSCKKEYSCENCKPLGWEFFADGVKYAGSITSLIFNTDSCGFTFSGSSYANKNNILALGTNFQPVKFNSDLSGITANRVGFIYTEGSVAGVITPFASGTSCCFNDIKVTLEKYTINDKILAGSFYGIAHKSDGTAVLITGGKFKTTF